MKSAGKHISDAQLGAIKKNISTFTTAHQFFETADTLYNSTTSQYDELLQQECITALHEQWKTWLSTQRYESILRCLDPYENPLRRDNYFFWRAIVAAAAEKSNERNRYRLLQKLWTFFSYGVDGMALLYHGFYDPEQRAFYLDFLNTVFGDCEPFSVFECKFHILLDAYNDREKRQHYATVGISDIPTFFYELLDAVKPGYVRGYFERIPSEKDVHALFSHDSQPCKKIDDNTARVLFCVETIAHNCFDLTEGGADARYDKNQRDGFINTLKKSASYHIGGNPGSHLILTCSVAQLFKSLNYRDKDKSLLNVAWWACFWDLIGKNKSTDYAFWTRLKILLVEKLIAAMIINPENIATIFNGINAKLLSSATRVDIMHCLLEGVAAQENAKLFRECVIVLQNPANWRASLLSSWLLFLQAAQQKNSSFFQQYIAYLRTSDPNFPQVTYFESEFYPGFVDAPRQKHKHESLSELNIIFWVMLAETWPEITVKTGQIIQAQHYIPAQHNSSASEASPALPVVNEVIMDNHIIQLLSFSSLIIENTNNRKILIQLIRFLSYEQLIGKVSCFSTTRFSVDLATFLKQVPDEIFYKPRPRLECLLAILNNEVLFSCEKLYQAFQDALKDKITAFLSDNIVSLSEKFVLLRILGRCLAYNKDLSVLRFERMLFKQVFETLYTACQSSEDNKVLFFMQIASIFSPGCWSFLREESQLYAYEAFVDFLKTQSVTFGASYCEAIFIPAIIASLKPLQGAQYEYYDRDQQYKKHREYAEKYRVFLQEMGLGFSVTTITALKEVGVDVSQLQIVNNVCSYSSTMGDTIENADEQDITWIAWQFSADDPIQSLHECFQMIPQFTCDGIVDFQELINAIETIPDEYAFLKKAMFMRKLTLSHVATVRQCISLFSDVRQKNSPLLIISAAVEFCASHDMDLTMRDIFKSYYFTSHATIIPTHSPLFANYVQTLFAYASSTLIPYTEQINKLPVFRVNREWKNLIPWIKQLKYFGDIVHQAKKMDHISFLPTIQTSINALLKKISNICLDGLSDAIVTDDALLDAIAELLVSVEMTCCDEKINVNDYRGLIRLRGTRNQEGIHSLTAAMRKVAEKYPDTFRNTLAFWFVQQPTSIMGSIFGTKLEANTKQVIQNKPTKIVFESCDEMKNENTKLLTLLEGPQPDFSVISMRIQFLIEQIKSPIVSLRLPLDDVLTQGSDETFRKYLIEKAYYDGNVDRFKKRAEFVLYFLECIVRENSIAAEFENYTNIYKQGKSEKEDRLRGTYLPAIQYYLSHQNLIVQERELLSAATPEECLVHINASLAILGDTKAVTSTIGKTCLMNRIRIILEKLPILDNFQSYMLKPLIQLLQQRSETRCEDRHLNGLIGLIQAIVTFQRESISDETKATFKTSLTTAMCVYKNNKCNPNGAMERCIRNISGTFGIDGKNNDLPNSSGIAGLLRKDLNEEETKSNIIEIEPHDEQGMGTEMTLMKKFESL